MHTGRRTSKFTRATLVRLASIAAVLCCGAAGAESHRHDPAAPPKLEPVPHRVSDSTTSVADLPRPARIASRRATDCPHLQAGLTRWNAAWLGADGMAAVPPGTRALVNGNDDIPAQTLIRMLEIPAGSELIFADQDATFHVTDVHVGGALRLGSPTCRLTHRIDFVFDTDEDVSSASVRKAIYDRAGLGIMVEPSGALDVFGRLYQPTWTRLAKTANAGAVNLQLSEAVDWEPGQRVVVVTSELRDYPYTDQNEVRTIAAVKSGSTVVLDAPLAYLHYGGPEYQVEVGLLTRSISLRTADRVLALAPTFGGHVLIHAGQARVSGAEIVRFGQQNFLGRYPLHMHHSGDVAGTSYFTDNSIWRSNWRCAVVHRTDNAIVSRNVAFDVWGHCYYLEDGVELGNEVSFNLAAKIKILGPVDPDSLAVLNPPTQDGFVLMQSSEFANPADRAAAGFYITNGGNRIFGNAASGGFTGYSFPNLPEAIGGSDAGIRPLDYGITGFDGNSAHTSAYLWWNAGCVYAGGLLTEVDDGGTRKLRYHSGREVSWDYLRLQEDTISNTKTFLCGPGIVHWGLQPRVVNLEAWDDDIMAIVFGSASIRSALVAGETGNTRNLGYRAQSWYRHGFQFYDTDTQTILRDVVFRNFHSDPYPGLQRSDNNCALFSMTHSDQYTPQRMNAVAGIHFAAVDDAQRICHDDKGTLSSRNFNFFDADGSATGGTGRGGHGEDGERDGGGKGWIVGSGYTDTWRLSERCVRNEAWGLWICPKRGTQDVAAIATVPNRGVRVVMYDLDGNALGENWYSTTDDFIDAQITGPSEVGWHHSFPGGVPDSFQIWTLQVPKSSYVLYSFSLPPGVSCSIGEAGWQAVPDFGALLKADGAAYTTDLQACFVRIPPTDIGAFESAGLSVPNQTWRGSPTPTTYFTVVTGCTSGNPACASITSTIPPVRRHDHRD
jgi:hypothetical protein